MNLRASFELTSASPVKQQLIYEGVSECYVWCLGGDRLLVLVKRCVAIGYGTTKRKRGSRSAAAFIFQMKT
jgi:hypothetical protein